MINKVIRGFTRMLGKPADWEESKHGQCGALAILDHEQPQAEGAPPMNTMVSAWDVTPDELRKLRLGAPVYLRVLGRGHPPVSIWVGDPPIDGKEPASDELDAFHEELRLAFERKLRALGVYYPMIESESFAELAFDAFRTGRVV